MLNIEMLSNIVKQEPKEKYILTYFDNGLVVELPYLKDNNGEEYVEVNLKIDYELN